MYLGDHYLYQDDHVPAKTMHFCETYGEHDDVDMPGRF